MIMQDTLNPKTLMAFFATCPKVDRGPFIVCCDGDPKGSYDTAKEAEAVRDMWIKNVRSAAQPSANSKKTWDIRKK